MSDPGAEHDRKWDERVARQLKESEREPYVFMHVEAAEGPMTFLDNLTPEGRELFERKIKEARARLAEPDHTHIHPLRVIPTLFANALRWNMPGSTLAPDPLEGAELQPCRACGIDAPTRAG